MLVGMLHDFVQLIHGDAVRIADFIQNDADFLFQFAELLAAVPSENSNGSARPGGSYLISA